MVLAVLFIARAGSEEAFTAFPDGATNVGNFLMQSVTQGLQFGVAVAVILFGVRTILGELVPAFQGIAAKVVPGAIPALDAPIVFPYAQNAVLIGFISSFVGGLVGLAVLSTWLNPAFGVALILPGLVPHFFTGGAAGVYGNATGGRRGAALGAFVNGLIITFLPAFLLSVLGSFGSANTTFGDADFGWLGLLLGWSIHADGALGLFFIALIALAILALGWVCQRTLVDAHWDPSPHRPSPTSTAGTTEGATAAATSSGTAKKYPKVLPPEGAPVPPARIEQ